MRPGTRGPTPSARVGHRWRHRRHGAHSGVARCVCRGVDRVFRIRPQVLRSATKPHMGRLLLPHGFRRAGLHRGLFCGVVQRAFPAAEHLCGLGVGGPAGDTNDARTAEPDGRAVTREYIIVTAPTTVGVWKLYVQASDGRGNIGMEVDSSLVDVRDQGGAARERVALHDLRSQRACRGSP